jgi:hypothetical protein
MGESENIDLRVNFDTSLRLQFHGASITSDAGLLAYRELDCAMGLTEMAAQGLQDSRIGKNLQHSLAAQLRQSLFGRLAGYEDTSDAERLSVDPAIRQVVGGRAILNSAASTSQMGRFETEVLTLSENAIALSYLSGKWIDRLRKKIPLKKIILDMDSSVSETYGRQEKTAYNGHFGCTCYHPLFCFNQSGDVEFALLREGNVHSAKDWKTVLEPVVARYRNRELSRSFRGDAGFANPEIYEFLESERFDYTIRLPANDNLYREIEPYLKRPLGRPANYPIVAYHDFNYRAATWNKDRRVISKVEWHPGELFPRVGFIVTNLKYNPKAIVHFYNHRGTAEQWIKEGKNAVKWTKLSCHHFIDNHVRLQLFVLAYNLGNFFRQNALPAEVKHWCLTTLREKIIKIGAKVIRHARYVVFQMAEVAISRELFQNILGRIGKLRQLFEADATG